MKYDINDYKKQKEKLNQEINQLEKELEQGCSSKEERLYKEKKKSTAEEIMRRATKQMWDLRNDKIESIFS